MRPRPSSKGIIYVFRICYLNAKRTHKCLFIEINICEFFSQWFLFNEIFENDEITFHFHASRIFSSYELFYPILIKAAVFWALRSYILPFGVEPKVDGAYLLIIISACDTFFLSLIFVGKIIKIKFSWNEIICIYWQSHSIENSGSSLVWFLLLRITFTQFYLALYIIIIIGYMKLSDYTRI